MFKNQKGITLIALIITIIVLLILAGVTIAMLTGSDSAPAKANEASQKNDIGALKDQVYLKASNAQLEYYDGAYVQAGATSNENSKKGVGAYVAYVLTNGTDAYGSKKTVGSASIKAVDNCGARGSDKYSTPTNMPADGTHAADIRIQTRDFYVLGYVEIQGGAIKWSEIKPITEAVPTGFTNVSID